MAIHDIITKLVVFFFVIWIRVVDFECSTIVFLVKPIHRLICLSYCMKLIPNSLATYLSIIQYSDAKSKETGHHCVCKWRWLVPRKLSARKMHPRPQALFSTCEKSSTTHKGLNIYDTSRVQHHACLHASMLLAHSGLTRTTPQRRSCDETRWPEKRRGGEQQRRQRRRRRK